MNKNLTVILLFLLACQFPETTKKKIGNMRQPWVGCRVEVDDFLKLHPPADSVRGNDLLLIESVKLKVWAKYLHPWGCVHNRLSQCTVYGVQCTAWTVQCKVYSLQCTLHTVNCTVYTVHCTLYTVHSSLNCIELSCLDTGRIRAEWITSQLLVRSRDTSGISVVKEYSI